ncbi:conjugal transfer protein [Streptomyces sp. 8L]|uniref:conjugal transfer protein n=1 Tax=Streptomyces sp. 8L TaxID=2877242 RepID=UPI001CD5D423|nr:conjugal transfer protein [Streptomyces sp. 8L]MCA1219297.1 conjugal transfer protein [Streptomyces sp. 8L]
MKLSHTQRGDHQAHQDDQDQDDTYTGEPVVEELGGWSVGGRAHTTGILRWAGWAVIVLGPILAVVALVSSTRTPAVRPEATASAPAPTGGQGAAGFATLFVDAYVSAGENSQSTLTPYYPAAADLDLQGTAGAHQAQQTTVVRLRQTADTVWSVTVAARVTEPEKSTSDDGALRYFQVPVATGPAGGGATGYVALSLPAEVTAPPRIEAPSLVYGPMEPASPSDPRTETVSEFLSAYLTGQGDISRILAPGTAVKPIRPAPYTTVAVEQIAVEGGTAVADPEATATAANGARTRLLVTITASGADHVQRPLTYALTLAARAGRWEVAALDGAPATAPPVSPAGGGAQ